MFDEYKYYKENGKLKRVSVKTDDTPPNPRYDYDGHIGKMMCWHRNYTLGDYKENKFADNEDFLNDLVRENIKDNTLINYVKNKKTSNGLELRYDRHEKMWQLWGTYYLFPLMSIRDAEFGIIKEYEDVTWLVDDIIEALPQEDKWKLLEKHAQIIFMPLFLYDHSGITMNTCGYSCRWDSGQVGYIYTDRKTILDLNAYYRNKKGKSTKVTKNNWKKAAYLWMEGEVEEYDQYLTGEVYGIIEEEYDAEDDTWEETDSCWGFFNSKFGSELIEDVARDYGISETLYDSMEEIMS
jgi:hypothetical protein